MTAPSLPAPAWTSRALGGVELVMRFAFFAIAPAAVVVATQLLPLGGALINIGLALLVFFFGEAFRGLAARRPWLKRVLGRQLSFEAYYRERPPRRFVFYVFYPLMLPFCLFNREARRELLLFKGYTVLTLGVLLVSSAVRFFTVYRPELGLREFWRSFAASFVLESIFVVAFLVPLTTTVVDFHLRRAHGRLIGLLLVALVSVGTAAGWLTLRRAPLVSLETRDRVVLRTRKYPLEAKAALTRALRVSFRARAQGGWGRDETGRLVGHPTDAAREALAPYYRADEAAAFDIWTTDPHPTHATREASPLMVLYAEGRSERAPIWLAMREDGTLVDDPRKLPRGALKAMQHAFDWTAPP